MKLFNKKNFSSLISHLSPKKGFTLIELLIVIAILGILATGVVIAINPLAKINSANLAKVETFDASIQNSLSINLVGEWTFDGNTNDTSGYGNNGTLVGNAAVTAANRKGQANKAATFDGTDDYINVGNVGVSANGPATIGGWVNFSVLASVGGNWGNLWTNLYQHPANNYLYIDNTGTRFAWVPQLNRWYHIVFTYSGNTSTAKLYIDSVQYSPINVDSVTIGALSSFKIGLGGKDYFNGGVIDDVRVYNQALLSFQVQQLYAQGLPSHLLVSSIFHF